MYVVLPQPVSSIVARDYPEMGDPRHPRPDFFLFSIRLVSLDFVLAIVGSRSCGRTLLIELVRFWASSVLYHTVLGTELPQRNISNHYCSVIISYFLQLYSSLNLIQSPCLEKVRRKD